MNVISPRTYPLKALSSITLALGVLSATAAESWNKLVDEMLRGTPMSQAATESKKNQTLIQECIRHCRPLSADYYRISEIVSCEQLAYPSIARNMGAKCSSEFKAVIDINTIVTNRFNESYIEPSTCEWRGNDYVLTATCGKSSARYREDAAKTSPRP